jgi:hypothetical protein
MFNRLLFSFSFKKNSNFLFLLNNLNIRFFTKKPKLTHPILSHIFSDYKYVSFLNFNVREVSPTLTAFVRLSKLKKLFFGSFFDLNFNLFNTFSFPMVSFFNIFFRRKTHLSFLISKKTSLIFMNFRSTNFNPLKQFVSTNLPVEFLKLPSFSKFSSYYSVLQQSANSDINFFVPADISSSLLGFNKYLNFEMFIKNCFSNSVICYTALLNKKRFLLTPFSLLNAKRSSKFYSNFF